jgi:hypothetical protein
MARFFINFTIHPLEKLAFNPPQGAGYILFPLLMGKKKCKICKFVGIVPKIHSEILM